MNSNLHVVSAAISDKGLSQKRPQNEDSFLEMGHCGIYAVADGVGGAQGGEVASQMAMEILSEAFTNKSDGADVEDVLRLAIESANTAIYQMALEVPKLESMATTIVALHIADNIATIGHVGDSRLYRVDPDGTLHRETEDHSMVADEVRAGRMTDEQAENHPSRNIINRALGADPIVEADLKTIMIGPGTSFLICSDGITRHINDDEIKEVLTSVRAPNDVCTSLKNLCYERGAEDNLTAVVIRIASDTIGKDLRNDKLSNDEENTLATARSFAVKELDQSIESRIEQAESNAASGRAIPETAGSLSKIITSAGMFLLGGLIGLGLYHLLLLPAPKPQSPQLSEMKSENISMTSFEKLRRTVDSDPAAYLKEIPPAQDAEDLYLQGRAYLLTGDFTKAHLSLLDAHKHLAGTDPSNAKTLAADIAAALVIANNPELQKEFRTAIEADKAAGNPANGSLNR